MSGQRIDLAALRTDCERTQGLPIELPSEWLLALVEAVEAAQRYADAPSNPAWHRVLDALAPFVFGDEEGT